MAKRGLEFNSPMKEFIFLSILPNLYAKLCIDHKSYKNNFKKMIQTPLKWTLKGMFSLLSEWP
jgi:hypothetical protein